MSRKVLPALLIAVILVSVISTVAITKPISSTQILPQNQTSGATSNGTLRVGYYLFPVIQYVALDLVFNSLIRLNESLQIVPDLATSWEISADHMNYTIHLVQNATWHNGKPFNASDVEFTYQTLLNNPGMCNYPCTDEALSKIESIDVKDSYTVVFQLNEPYAPFLHRAGSAYIFPKHIWQTRDATQAYDFSRMMNGTGPFMFESIFPGSNLTLLANTNYFRGPPHINEIVYKYYPDTELPNALENNQIDVIPGWILPEKMAEIQNTTGKTTEIANETGFFSLDPNFRRPITANKTVRQAILCAINVSKIIQDVFLGYAEPAYSPIPPVLTYWYNSNVSRYDYNTTRAEELLDQAGYPRNATGQRFHLSLVVGDWDVTRIETAQIIQQCLEDVGINVTLETKTVNEVITTVMNYPYDFDLYMGAMGDLGADPDQSILWHSQGEQNYMGYSNSTLDSLLEKGVNTTDDAIRKQYYDEFQQIVASDLPRILICRRTHLWAYNNDFYGFVNMPGTYAVTSAYSIERVYYYPTLSGEGKCPIRICFVDSEGRRTGFFNGSIVNEIPNSFYDEASNTVKIPFPSATDITVRNPNDPYGRITIIKPSYFVVEVNGTGTGHYRLEVVNIAHEYKSVVIVDGNTTLGNVDCYYIVVWQDGMIFNNYEPVYIQIMYTMGKQFIIPAEGVDPDSYDRLHANRFIRG